MAAMVLAACTQSVRLSTTDRHTLASQEVIPVVYYETPPPVLSRYSKIRFPAPTEIYRTVGAEPAGQLAERLSRTLGRLGGLRNVKIHDHPLLRPVPDSKSGYRTPFQKGLLLEVWVDQWIFGEIAGKPGFAALRFDARSRLIRAEDGKVLWSTGRCQVGSPKSREYRIASIDLSKAGKLHKLMSDARNECVRQIARDFDDRSVNRGASESSKVSR